MNQSEMKTRTKEFTLRILKLVNAIPATRAGNAVANQLVRSGSSVGANYRALCRAKSRADFIHKTSVVEEEADESSFWLEVAIDGDLLPANRVKSLLAEATVLTAIMVASRKTARRRAQKETIANRRSTIAKSMPLRLEITTPEEKAYSEEVDFVVLPGSEGELGVYPNHIPLLTTLQPGELRVVKDGKATAMAVGEGFVEITGSSVSVLTDMAIHAAQIDEGAAEKAVERARAAMKDDLGKEEVASVQASLNKALAQLHVKRRRH